MAKKPTTALVAPPDIDVQASDDDVLQITQDGNAIKTFLAGLAAWFIAQRAWEKKADARLMAAKSLPTITDAAGDEVAQKFITGTSAMQRDFGVHSTIKGLLHRLHKRASVIHNRVDGPFEEAKAVATNLHNRYVEQEQRRVREENTRREREAQQQAERDRQAEVKRLADEAAARELDSPALSERERTFVEAFVKGSTPEMAASAAGYKDALKTAGKLLITPKIETAIDLAREALALREQAAAVAQQPLDVQFEEEKANVGKAGSDVNRWKAEVYDVEAFMAALLDPRTRTQLGIPADVATYLPTKLNEHARSLHEQMNRWPGVRAKRDTTVR